VSIQRFALRALTALIALAGATAGAQEYEFKDITLDNGLRVVTMEDFSTPIVAVQVWYHVGSKNEDPNRQGFAHMFEHMMFRGTDRLGPKDHFEYIRRVGGNANAFTSFDYTAYVNELPSNQLELALWLEAERMMYPQRGRAEGFTTERHVVAEERRQDLNVPYGTVAEEVLLPVVFKEHSLPLDAHRPHPPPRSGGTRSELQAFWNAYYVPNNAVLVDGRRGQARRRPGAAAKKYFGWMPRCPEPRRSVAADEPPQTEPREADLRGGPGPGAAGRLHLPRRARKPSRLRRRSTSSWACSGYGDSSRLYLDLVKDQQIATQVMASTYGFEKAGRLRRRARPSLPFASDLDTVLAASSSEHLQRVVD
jgi:zinc protease